MLLTSLKKILVSHFFRYSLIPIFVVEVALLVLYFSINTYISNKNTDLLLENAQSYTKEVLKNEAKFISDELNGVSRIARILQNEHQAIIKNPTIFGLPNGEPILKVAENGVLYKENKVGSSIYYSSHTKIGAKELEKVRHTEAMDITLKSIVDTNSNIVAAYFNSWDNMNRLYPFIDKTYEQYGSHINMEDYNFYYLADSKHNPSKAPTWTSAYLDPAGNGWMLSSVVPIYNGDFLEGVTGIDITIDSFVKNILNRKLPYNAHLFMVDKDGMIIAMSEYIENLLDLKELKEHLYTNAILKTIEKPEEFNILKNNTPFSEHFKKLIEGKANSASLTIMEKDYLALAQKVEETDWELMILIDKSEIFDSVVYLKNLSNKIGYFAIGFLLLFYVIFFYALLKRINIFSDVITKPIIKLSEETKKINETDSKINIIDTDILEINQLNKNFSNMIEELNTKTEKLNIAKLHAEESSRAKDDFLANMSHELKTPLNSVNLISSIMVKNKKGNLDEKDLKNLNIINNSGKDLLYLIKDVLDISQLEAGELKVNLTDFDFCKVLENTYNSFEHEMENKNLRFSFHCDEKIGLIHSDEDKIKKVLKNLVSNSLKFTEEGEVKLIAKANEKFVEIEVIDTGVGIPQESIGNVFDKFKQIDASTTRKFGGTGLGLAITKQIITLLDGYIEVKSQVNVGSTFKVKFKRNKELVRERNISKKIVLFNNDPIKFISLAIEIQKSFELVSSSNFDEFIDISKKSDFDYLIIDSSKIEEKNLFKLESLKEKVIVIYDEELNTKDYVNKIIQTFVHTFKKPFYNEGILSFLKS
jgi:signal transduction histidine kinase